MAKRGRKPNHFRDSQGNIINGLGRRPDQRFYSITNQSVYFGKDEREAIRRFRLWQANQNQEGKLYADMQGSPLKLSKDLQGIISAREEAITTKEGKRQRADATITVDSLWDWIGHMLRTQPKLCAQKTGIEQLNYLDDLQPPTKSLALSKVGDLYKTKLDLTATEANRSVKWWNQFVKMTGCRTVKEIKADHVQAYFERIIRQFKTAKRSPAWVKHRFGKIKTMLNHALTRGQDQDEIQRVLGLTKMLIAPKDTNGVDPNPISRDDLEKLLKTADLPMQTMILTAINGAFYPIDICRLTVDACNLKTGVIVFVRTKAGKPIPRVAKLWKRTITALTEYQKQHPHKAVNANAEALVFANSKGNPIKKDTVVKWFSALRDEAEVSDSVVFSSLRDGAATHSGADVNQTKLLLGHSLGQVDKYKLRTGSSVAKCCKSVEAHYFLGGN